jgi:hypothetical protein
MTRRLITALVPRALYLAVSIPADGSISARRGFAIDRRRVCEWATDVVAAELSDEIGSRLTGSPGCRRAEELMEAEMKRIGLANIHREP